MRQGLKRYDSYGKVVNFMSYCIYLRKSRKDLEAEAHGEGETLARHERILLSLAKSRDLIIGNIYREVVSGETIAARPVMQQLLREIESGVWDGVLVMEVERLARGDTIDQGVIQRAFQYSDTLIITPTKTYDPANEFDEEYFEFGLFMSRREYKTIRRRMQAGRLAAVREGKWPFNQAPYGCRIVKLENEKGYSLAADESEYPTLQLIFRLFTGPGRIGVTRIANYLNDRKIPPRKSQTWSSASIRGILSNPVYDKQVPVGRRKVVMTMQDGRPLKTRPHAKEYDTVPAAFPRFIDHDVFLEAQDYLGKGKPKAPNTYAIKNPLAGLITCGCCHKKMIRRPRSGKDSKGNVPYDLLMCPTYQCPTIGAPLDLVEKEVVAALADWVRSYELDPASTYQSQADDFRAQLDSAREEHDRLEAQKGRLYDFLETGVYSSEVFLERSKMLENKLSESASRIAALEKAINEEILREQNACSFVPSCRNLLEHYWDLAAPDRNSALRALLETIEYKKLEKNKRGNLGNPTFELTLKPKIPRK